MVSFVLDKNHEQINIDQEELWRKPSRRKFTRPTEREHDVVDEMLMELKPSRDEIYKTRAKSRNKEFDNRKDVRLRRVDRFNKDREVLERLNLDKDDEIQEFPNDDHTKFYMSRTEKLNRNQIRDQQIVNANDDIDREIIRRRQKNSAKLDRRPRNKQFDKTDYDKDFDLDNFKYNQKEEKVDVDYRHNADEFAIASKKPPKKFPKQYEEYSDYYDMKRVIGLKESLPILLRRSKGIVSIKFLNEVLAVKTLINLFNNNSVV